MLYWSDHGLQRFLGERNGILLQSSRTSHPIHILHPNSNSHQLFIPGPIQEHSVSRGLSGTHFFINVPAEHRNPIFLNTANARIIKSHIQQFNTVLDEYITAFGQRHREINVLKFDSFGFFNDVLDRHEEFGFEDVSG